MEYPSSNEFYPTWIHFKNDITTVDANHTHDKHQPPSPDTSDSDSGNSCGLCGEDTEQRCKRCKETYYCSVECQTRDWSTHKKYCRSPKPHNPLANYDKVCDHCLRTGTTVSCEKCGVNYCDEKCMKRGMKDHSESGLCESIRTSQVEKESLKKISLSAEELLKNPIFHVIDMESLYKYDYRVQCKETLHG